MLEKKDSMIAIYGDQPMSIDNSSLPSGSPLVWYPNPVNGDPNDLFHGTPFSGQFDLSSYENKTVLAIDPTSPIYPYIKVKIPDMP